LTLSSSFLSASTLESVLAKIDQMGGSPLMSIMVNLAETIASPTTKDRLLMAGDRVILGYDAAGNAVSATAGPMGVLVPSAMALSMPTGLAAGLYPVGSALYALPPAGQLSLFHETGAGQALEIARDLALSRIDGTVTNVIEGLLLPDLVPAMLVTVYDGQGGQGGLLAIEEIHSTVLGAVNAGEIVTQIRVSLQPGATIDLALAGISRGAKIAVQDAQNRSTAAGSLQIRQIGAIPEMQALALNLAHSASGISGAVLNRVEGQTVDIGEIVTTVIGAVNGGRVNGAD
jgi:hypothetical protein